MTTVHTVLMIVAALLLGGCSHSQWASVELATVGASWLHPVATVVHMTASAGRAMTDPQDELRDKVQQREEERKKELPSEQAQPGPPRTETK
jgi:major membrane immunogen (membrane-anchored lipoprotein)